jgi:hypothetical protein
VVLNRPSPEHKVEDGEFEPNEVYAIDIVVSTGEAAGGGRPKTWGPETQPVPWARASRCHSKPGGGAGSHSWLGPDAPHLPPSHPPPGEGKPKLVDEKETTVYKRALDVEYMLKMKASRWGGGLTAR